MARIDEKCYENMMTALYTFANVVYTKTSEMQTLAYTCTNVLGEEDSGTKEIYKKVSATQIKYAEAAKEARDIAAALQEELEDQKKEDQIWNSEDE